MQKFLDGADHPVVFAIIITLVVTALQKLFKWLFTAVINQPAIAAVFP
jgi:hypothetical protein